MTRTTHCFAAMTRRIVLTLSVVATAAAIPISAVNARVTPRAFKVVTILPTFSIRWHVTYNRHHAADTPVPLESIPLFEPDGFGVIPPGNSASYQGRPITHGLQGTNRTLIWLRHGYSRLSGTVYVDDKQGPVCLNPDNGTCTIRFYDESNIDHTYGYNFSSDQPTLFSYTFTQAISSTTFSIDVHNVSLLGIEFSTPDGSSLTDIVATLTPTFTKRQSVSSSTRVQAITPNVGRAVPSNRAALFQWQPFRGATAYQLHAWLVHPLGNSPIQQGTPTTFAITVYGKTTYVWRDRSFLPGLYRYELLPVNGNGYALADWSPPTEFKIIG